MSHQHKVAPTEIGSMAMFKASMPQIPGHEYRDRYACPGPP